MEIAEQIRAIVVMLAVWTASFFFVICGSARGGGASRRPSALAATHKHQPMDIKQPLLHLGGFAFDLFLNNSCHSTSMPISDTQFICNYWRSHRGVGLMAA